MKFRNIKLVPIFISDLNDAEDQTKFVGKAQIFKRKSRKDWSTNKNYHHQLEHPKIKHND